MLHDRIGGTLPGWTFKYRKRVDKGTYEPLLPPLVLTIPSFHDEDVALVLAWSFTEGCAV